MGPRIGHDEKAARMRQIDLQIEPRDNLASALGGVISYLWDTDKDDMPLSSAAEVFEI